MNCQNQNDYRIDRRSFIKTTAFSVGAIRILSAGTALADGVSSSDMKHVTVWERRKLKAAVVVPEVTGENAEKCIQNWFEAFRAELKTSNNGLIYSQDADLPSTVKALKPPVVRTSSGSTPTGGTILAPAPTSSGGGWIIPATTLPNALIFFVVFYPGY